MQPRHRIAVPVRLAPAVVERRVVVPDGAGEDGGPASGEHPGDDPGLLQRLPAQLQEQPLLGVHRRRLTGRDAEEAGVEPVDLVEEGAMGGGAGGPAARGRLPDGVLTAAEQLPESGGIGCPGEAAGETDDGDRCGVGATHDL